MFYNHQINYPAEKTIANNKFKFLLDKEQDSTRLKKDIEKHLNGNKKKYGKQTLYAAFDYLESFCRNKDGADRLRAEGTLEKNHALSIARNAAWLGLDFEIVLSALLHDTIEDANIDERGKTKLQVFEDIVSFAGETVARNVGALARKNEPFDKEEYEDYLKRLYNSNNLQLAIVKYLDTLDNLNSLGFEACPQDLKESTVDKALSHVALWRKLNPEIFSLMFALISQNMEEYFEKRIWDEYERMQSISLRQYLREKRVWSIANLRERIDLPIIRSLPNRDSWVIVLYLPESNALQSMDHMELEFPDSIGKTRVKKLLKTHLPFLQFHEAESKMPRKLVCTHIFKARLPSTMEEYKQFNDGMRKMNEEYLNFIRVRHPEFNFASLAM